MGGQSLQWAATGQKGGSGSKRQLGCVRRAGVRCWVGGVGRGLWGYASLRWSGICRSSRAWWKPLAKPPLSASLHHGMPPALVMLWPLSRVQQRPREVRTCLQLAPGVLWFCQQNWKGIAELILPLQIGFEMEIVRLPGGGTGVLRRCRVAASGTGSSAHTPEGLCWARLCSRGMHEECHREPGTATGQHGQAAYPGGLGPVLLLL